MILAGARIEAAQLQGLCHPSSSGSQSRGFQGDWAAQPRSCSAGLLSTPSATQLCGVEQCPVLGVGSDQAGVGSGRVSVGPNINQSQHVNTPQVKTPVIVFGTCIMTTFPFSSNKLD